MGGGPGHVWWDATRPTPRPTGFRFGSPCHAHAPAPAGVTSDQIKDIMSTIGKVSGISVMPDERDPDREKVCPLPPPSSTPNTATDPRVLVPVTCPLGAVHCRCVRIAFPWRSVCCSRGLVTCRSHVEGTAKLPSSPKETQFTDTGTEPAESRKDSLVLNLHPNSNTSRPRKQHSTVISKLEMVIW